MFKRRSCHFISNIEWYITVIVTINVKVNIYAHPWWSKIIDKCLWTGIFVAKLMKTVNDNIEIASFSLLIKLMFRTYPILYDVRTISNFHNKSHLWNLSMYTISKVQTLVRWSSTSTHIFISKYNLILKYSRLLL